MASTARIEELKKKFDENPRRYFAPLANEHRKAGDIQQAIALCRAHLPQQAAHISGHIVLAQALYEAGDVGESRQEFETALGLDPENLIALRFLGDIARESRDHDGARTWYRRVLEVDPRNDEIHELLRAIDVAAAASSPARDASPAEAHAASAPHAMPPEELAAAETTEWLAPAVPPAAAGDEFEFPEFDAASLAADPSSQLRSGVELTHAEALAADAAVSVDETSDEEALHHPALRRLDSHDAVESRAEPAAPSSAAEEPLANEAHEAWGAISADTVDLADTVDFDIPSQQITSVEPAPAEAAPETTVEADATPLRARTEDPDATPPMGTPPVADPDGVRRAEESAAPEPAYAELDELDAGLAFGDLEAADPILDDWAVPAEASRPEPDLVIGGPVFEEVPLGVETPADDSAVVAEPLVTEEQSLADLAAAVEETAQRERSGLGEIVDYGGDALASGSYAAIAASIPQPPVADSFDRELEASSESRQEESVVAESTLVDEHDLEPESIAELELDASSPDAYESEPVHPGDSLSHETDDVELRAEMSQAEEHADEPALAGTSAELSEPQWESTEEIAVPQGFAAHEASTESVMQSFGAEPLDAAEPEAGPFVTETMAQLYLAQGFRDEALGVYRELLARTPSDESLQRRIAELEAAAAQQPAEEASTEAFAGVATAHEQHVAEPTHESAAPGGPSARSFFRALADRRIERRAAEPVPDESSAFAPSGGRPTRAAESELSLDHVFAESRQSAPGAESSPASSFSFDQFFSEGAARQPDRTPASSPNGSSTSSPNDIEQFAAWLEGLKKK